MAQPEWDVATEPISTLSFLSDHVATKEEQQALSRYVASLYRPHLGDPESATESAGEIDVGHRLLVSKVLYLLAITLREPEQVDRMANLGVAAIGFGKDGQLDLTAVPGDLLSIALASAVEREGEPFFRALRATIADSTDAGFREKALWAIGLTRDPELASEVRSLGFMYSLRLNEIPRVIGAQSARVENRRVVFEWVRRLFPFAQGFMPERYLASAPRGASGVCDRASRDEVEAFFAAYADKIELCEHLVHNQMGLAIPELAP